MVKNTFFEKVKFLPLLMIRYFTILAVSIGLVFPVANFAKKKEFAGLAYGYLNGKWYAELCTDKKSSDEAKDCAKKKLQKFGLIVPDRAVFSWSCKGWMAAAGDELGAATQVSCKPNAAIASNEALTYCKARYSPNCKIFFLKNDKN